MSAAVRASEPGRDLPRSKPVVRVVGPASDHVPSTLPKPKVALVRAPLVGTLNSVNNEATPCVAFAYIAAYVRKRGYDCTIVDGIQGGLNRYWPLEKYPGYQCQGMTFEEVLDAIPADAGVIGFSAMFSGEWPVLRDLISAARERFPRALLVAGGEHITALTEYSLRDCPALDVCVRGEGEHTMFEVLECRTAGEDFDKVSGVGYLDSNQAYRENAGLPRIRDIDNIPWPEWPEGYLETFWKAEKSYGVLTERDMPMIVSRGCPFQCTFCSNPNMWTTRYVLRSIDDILTEIKHYIAKYDITAIQLYDLTAITKKGWAVELFRRLIGEGIKLNWSLPSGTRSEALDEETLSLLKETGCNYLVYAPESGSPRTLKAIKKQISLEELTKSVLTAKRLGLTVRTNLIIGFPDETRADVFRTIFYGLGLAVRGADEVSINIFSPYPGTELFARLLDEGRVTVNDAYFLALTSLNSDYTVVNPMTVNEAMSSRELALYRIGFMLINYALGYVVYPGRIVRTVRNIFSESRSATVFEHRLKDLIRRKRRAA